MSSRSRRRAAAEERFTSGNRVTLLRDGPEVFGAMLEAMAQARRRVVVEMYWFASDHIGQKFRDALVDASQRGLEVRVTVDAVGSLGLSTEFFRPLRDFQQVRIFNPIAPWRSQRLSRLSRRDHRKLVIADDVAFTGGINVADAWAPTDPEVLPWRDDAVRVEGPAVVELADCFNSVWSWLESPESLPQSQRPEVSSHLYQTPSARVAVLPHAGVRQRRSAFNAYYFRVRRARHRVWLANAYFLPSRRMTNALRDAARRGIDVRVILPSRSDVEIVRHASRAMWTRLLASGVRLYEFQPRILHSKTAVVDGEWATVGSFNLDYLSLLSNLELNVSVLDRAFAKTVEDSFERDLEDSVEVNFDVFQSRSLGHRALERVSYWFRSWL
jgi:cardiolipin synthase